MWFSFYSVCSLRAKARVSYISSICDVILCTLWIYSTELAQSEPRQV